MLLKVKFTSKRIIILKHYFVLKRKFILHNTRGI